MIRQLYLDYFLENQKQADELYTEMLKISRQQFCKAVNSLSLQEFKEWLIPESEDHDIFSLEYIGEGSEYDWRGIKIKRRNFRYSS